MNTFYSEEELAELGIKKYGKDVKIGRHAILYTPQLLEIGDRVQIDDFAIISGNIVLHNNIHLAHFCRLYGGKSGIEMDDYSAVSSGCVIYSSSDDYSGHSMTNPTIPDQYKPVKISGTVHLGKHVVVGCHSVILPGVNIGEGTSVGSMTLCKHDLASWGIYAGIPARRIGERARDICMLEEEYSREVLE